MSDKKYKVIVSDRTKRMLGTHIRFMAQVNKDAAKTKKQELMEAMRSLERMPQRFPFFEEAYMPTNVLSAVLRSVFPDKNLPAITWLQTLRNRPV